MTSIKNNILKFMLSSFIGTSPGRSENPFENNAYFSCYCRTTNGSSCNDLEKKAIIEKDENG